MNNKNKKSTAKNNNKPVIGRPRKAVKLIMTKKFTMKDLEAANKGVIAPTLYAHVQRALQAGELVEHSVIHTGTVGKPKMVYINAKLVRGVKASKLVKAAKAIKAKAPVVAPVAAVAVTEPVVAPVAETSAVVETVASPVGSDGQPVL